MTDDPTPLAARIAAALDLKPKDASLGLHDVWWESTEVLLCVWPGQSFSLWTPGITLQWSLVPDICNPIMVHRFESPTDGESDTINRLNDALDGMLVYALEQAGETAFLAWLRGAEVVEPTSGYRESLADPSIPVVPVAHSGALSFHRQKQ